jgi:hypothetical protein
MSNRTVIFNFPKIWNAASRMTRVLINDAENVFIGLPVGEIREA